MASSPLARVCSRNPGRRPQLHQPGHSSTHSTSSSPTYNVQARRKRQYKSQDSSRSSFPTPDLLGASEETPEKQLLRRRFKARYFERARERRANGSDGFDIDDNLMDEEDEDIFNDEIYRRVMLNDNHRSQYAMRVSFEQEFGSSIDPNMYEDMNALEREFTGQAPNVRTLSPPPDELDDALIQEYLSELEEMERCEARQSAMAVPTHAIDVDTDDINDLQCLAIPNTCMSGEQSSS